MYHGAIIRTNAPTDQNPAQVQAQANIAAATPTEPDAQEILKQAKIEAENIRQKALLEAKQERDVILKQAKIDSDKKLAAHILQLSQDFRQSVRQQEAKIGKVVASTIRQIISDIPDENVQRDVVKTALRNFADESALKLRVAPDSFDKAWWTNWKWAMDNNFDVNIIIKDPNLAQGRCILEFANHKVDIGIQTQLDSLQQIATGCTSTSAPKNSTSSQKQFALQTPTDQPDSSIPSNHPQPDYHQKEG